MAGCGGGHHDSSVDDHGAFKCPRHIADNDCGVLDREVVLNRAAGEYLVVWRARYDEGPVGVYARRYDARTGEPLARPERLFSVSDLLGTLLTAFDPATRQYVIALQVSRREVGTRPRIEVRRFDEALRSAVPATRLGTWRLAGMVAEPGGRIALIGVEGEPDTLDETSRPAALRVETLDSHDASIRVERRRGKPGQALAAGAVASTYDPSLGRVLVAWFPGARPDRLPAVRFASFRAARADRAATALGRTAPPGITAGLACNARRRDCMLVYSTGGVDGQRIDAQLVDGRGRRVGRTFTVASGRVDDPRVESSANAYSVTWWTPVAASPSGTVEARAVEARVAGARQVQITHRYGVPGIADVGQRSDAGTRLLAWVQERRKNVVDLSPDIQHELRTRLVK